MQCLRVFYKLVLFMVFHLQDTLLLAWFLCDRLWLLCQSCNTKIYQFIRHFNPGIIFVHKLSSAIAWGCEKKQGTFFLDLVFTIFIHFFFTAFREKKTECAYCRIPMERASGYSENSGTGVAVCPPVAFFWTCFWYLHCPFTENSLHC